LVRVFGSSQNLASFAEHVTSVLEKAGLDYERGLGFVEIYLGHVFAARTSPANAYRLYDPGIDACRLLFGEAAVKARLDRMIGDICRLMPKYYLSGHTERWRQLEENLGFKLDFNEYYSRAGRDIYCPAEETAALLFESAIRGTGEFAAPAVTRFACRYAKEVGKPVRFPLVVNRRLVRINCYRWRKWIYGLWGRSAYQHQSVR